MSRPFVAVIVAVGTLVGFPAAGFGQGKDAPTPEQNAYLNNPDMIAAGLKLLQDKNLAINAAIDFRPNIASFAPTIAPRFSALSLNFGSLSREHKAVTEQLARETNAILKQQLEIQRTHLEVQLEQTKVALAQAKTLDQIRDQSVTAFEYQKKRDDSLLRRLEYTFRPGKLVVVVADFSSGGSSEGVEIADEIANGLQELRSKCGIDTEILVGEIKSGVVIRSEQMALDVGQHFPKGTAYAVVWGTLSPRTVGKFRPHVTCAIKVDDERGLSRSYTIDPESQPLPLGNTPEAQRRDQHRHLVAFACAVVPGCYASYEITHDRKPDLERFFKFLESGGPETAKIAAEYRKELFPLTRWIETRSYPTDGRPKYEFLRRMTPVSKEGEFPRLIMNTKDGSMMTLLTEPGSERAKRFKDGSSDYILYIDVTETTNRQFVSFLTECGNQNEGGADWLKLDTLQGKIRLEADKKFSLVEPKDNYEHPVTNVSYFGALSYCRWAGKELPRVQEWREAAAANGSGKYPWGDVFGPPETVCGNASNMKTVYPTHRIGSFPTDRSRIGCLDMAGNVSEWCAEFHAGSESARSYCGGNCGDAKPESFEINRAGSAPQVTHHPWLGFRGVVRIRVPVEKP